MTRHSFSHLVKVISFFVVSRMVTPKELLVKPVDRQKRKRQCFVAGCDHFTLPRDPPKGAEGRSQGPNPTRAEPMDLRSCGVVDVTSLAGSLVERSSGING